MNIEAHVIRVRSLSDADLQTSLGTAVGAGRELAALVVAHLGEVEARRLHLLAGYSSMFEYCTTRLAMSEDEACRRIDVARLALRIPALLERLASGDVSLSVAALLKHVLTETNHLALLAAVSGKTVARAREVLAEWFPRPDAPASIRKLPDRTSDTTAHPSLLQSGARPLLEAFSAPAGLEVPLSAPSTRGETTTVDPSGTTRLAEPALPVGGTTLTPASAQARRSRESSPIEPLSPGRFKVTFTADANLKRKLELARDLLRHSVPQGDLATVIGRAIDLLIEKTERRRFGQTKSDFNGKAQETKEGASHPQARNASTVRNTDATTAATEPASTTPVHDAPLHDHAAPHDRAPTHDSARTHDSAPIHDPAPIHQDALAHHHALTRNRATTDDAAAPHDPTPIHDSARTHDPAPIHQDALAHHHALTRNRATTDDAAAPHNPAAPHDRESMHDRATMPNETPTVRAQRPSRHLANEVRRAVLERDGMRCSWQAPDGTRCNSRAWLEYDHIIPRGQGGANDAANIRPFCRAHNRLEAERAYGQATITRIITRRRATREAVSPRTPSGQRATD